MSIPASLLVSVLGAVISAGGNALDLTGLVLTESAVLPFGAPVPFYDAPSVAAYFGDTSDEAEMAGVYFNGYNGATNRPGQILFSRYANVAIAAFMRGGSGLTLSEIQAITSGTLTIKIDGVDHTTSSLDLSGATSPSNAAALITTALTLVGAAVTWDSNFGAFVATSGTTGATSTIAFATGSDAAALKLTQATGALVSQGSNSQTASVAMEAIIGVNQNWACFSSTFEPDLAGKEDFATWAAGYPQRFVYVPWDTDITATENPSSFTGLTYWLSQNNVQGTIAVWDDKLAAAGVLGWAASLDFNAIEGRATLKFRQFVGVTPSVTDRTVAENLEANGYNYYGSFANATETWEFMSPGVVSGDYLWADSYVNAIWMNANLQLAEINLLLERGSIPYNAFGYASIKTAGNPVLQQAKTFGAIRAGVTLSDSQKADINAQAGIDIARTIEDVGYYFQVQDANPTVRQQRLSPPCYVWFTDGQSVHKLVLNSFNVQ